MDVDEQEHLIELRKVYLKRLRVLELKWAQFGYGMLVGEIVDISDLREAIADIDKKLPVSMDQNVHTEQVKGSFPVKKVEIVVEGEIRNWKPEIQDAAKWAFAAIMGITVEQITTLNITLGSVKILLEVPAEAAKTISDLFVADDPILQELGITRVRLVEDAIEIKEDEIEEEPESILDKLIIGLIMVVWFVSKMLAILWFIIVGYILVFQPDWPLWVKITVILATVINALAHGGSGNSSPPPSSPSPPSPQTPEELVDEEEKKYRELQKKKIYK